MAFPSIATVGYSEETIKTNSHDVIIPTGTANGDLLILLLAFSEGPTLSGFPAGWTQLLRSASTVQTGEVWYKFATGAETNFAYTSSGVAVKSQSRCLRITGAHTSTVPAAGVAAATNINPNPPSLNPVDWDVEDTLWIVFVSSDNGTTATAYPTNYTSNQFTDQTGTIADDSGMSMASRTNAIASEDPGTFTLNISETWHAFTIAVRPVGAAAGGVVTPRSLALLGVGA